MRSILLLFTLLFGSLAVARADAKLGDGDLFRLSVSGAPKEYTAEFELDYTIDDGSITVPNVGRVRAAGLTPTQLAAFIEKRLKEEKIFTNPTVLINVAQVNRTIVVGGAVRSPGRHPWAANMTLTMAIATAGGPADFAQDKVKLVRDGKAQEYSRKALKKDTAGDPKILPNDYIEMAGEF
jgi:polysaccharide export outer membrane protein